MMNWHPMNRMRQAIASVTAVAFTTLVVTSSAPIAWAQQGVGPAHTRVAVFVSGDGPQTEALASVMQAMMREEARQLVNVTVVAGNDEPTTPISERILPFVETGYRALNERDGASAIDQFEKAYALMTGHEGVLSKRLVARVMKGLAVSQALEELPDMETTMRTALNVWPDQTIADYGWTLDLRTAFNEVKIRHDDAMLGAIEIDSEPEGAEVRVNGELKGFAPLEVENLSPGRHWVEVGKDGYRWNGMFVEVPEGDSTIHFVELDPSAQQANFEAAQRSVMNGLTRGQLTRPFADLAASSKAEKIVALRLSTKQDGFHFNGYVYQNGTHKKVSTVLAQGPDLAAKMRSFLATQLGIRAMADSQHLPLDGPPQVTVFEEGDVILDPNDPIFAEEVKEREPSITDEWWFWVVVGGALAGLTAGGVMLFNADATASLPSGKVVIDVHGLR